MPYFFQARAVKGSAEAGVLFHRFLESFPLLLPLASHRRMLWQVWDGNLVYATEFQTRRQEVH